MKFLPYYSYSTPGDATIHLLFFALPESWLDIIQTSPVFASNKDAFLFPLEMALEVPENEGVVGIGVCGVTIAFEEVPKFLSAGMKFTKWPVSETLDPYFTLPYDYTLLSFTAINANARNPFHIDNFMSSKFEIVYGVSDVSALLVPQNFDGYEDPEIYGDGYFSIVCDETHRNYGDSVHEKAYRFNEQYRQESVINLRGANPFIGDLGEGHMFVSGCYLHLTNEPYFDCINGVPSDGYSMNSVPGEDICHSLGLYRIWRTGFVGLEFSLFLYLQNHGIEPTEFIGGTSRPPVIFLPPPWEHLSQPGSTILVAATFLHKFRKYESLMLTIHGEPLLIGGEGLTF